MTSQQFNRQKEELADYLRRFGIEGESAFRVIIYQYVKTYPQKLRNLKLEVLQKWQSSYQAIANQHHITNLLREISIEDSFGLHLPDWYQFFVGRRYREDSGKFFTPKPVASAMVRLLPRIQNPVIMDPTCGGGTFLVEASRIWQNDSCTLLANDIEMTLVELSMSTLSLVSSQEHIKQYISVNIFEPTQGLSKWYGCVDYILANPPFSLRIDHEQFDSPLFSAGYRNSDALFIDQAYKLLKPGGRLVCLLPHSIIANQEFSNLRKLIENRWKLLGVICLPEGVFHLSSGTTTRADIVVLDKKSSHGCNSKKKMVFASVPSVGVRLNNRAQAIVPNDLEQIIENLEVKEVFGI